jgi:FkbM family methyltransferase
MFIFRHKRTVLNLALLVVIVYALIYTILNQNWLARNEHLYIDLGGEDAHNPNKTYVFFDLGANSGDSLASFFQLKSHSSNKQLPVRFHFSEAVDINWTVFAFEANPLFSPALLDLKQSLEPRHRVHLFNGTAAWTRNGSVDFYLDVVNTNNGFWGSSLKSSHPDVVKSGKKHIRVPCVDVADLVARFTPDDLVIMKIDIEGAEYDMILHLFKRDVLRLVDYVAVEYHPNSINVFSAEDAFNYVIKSAGAKPIKWV